MDGSFGRWSLVASMGSMSVSMSVSVSVVLAAACVGLEGGLAFASEMKVVATSKSPSRSRCMAIARFMRVG